MKKYDIAIVGASGLVGETILKILEERKFPINNLYLLASERSLGRSFSFRDSKLSVELLDKFDFSKVQVAFFSAGASVSKEYAPKATEAGAVVIDNTSYFRYEDDVPLIVPECNVARLEDYSARGIIANPNCSTIQMVVALYPIYKSAGIERINVATYQAVSGAGRSAMDRLSAETSLCLKNENKDNTSPIPFAFNVVPQIDVFLDNGFTKEEMKMVWETKKILGDNNISINPTCVRVPVYYGHSEAIHIETKTKISVEDVIKLLERAPGVTVVDNRLSNLFPTPRLNAAHKDDVFVGRVREDTTHPRGINLWVVSDNVRKGAALNSIQIAESLIEEVM